MTWLWKLDYAIELGCLRLANRAVRTAQLAHERRMRSEPPLPTRADCGVDGCVLEAGHDADTDGAHFSWATSSPLDKDLNSALHQSRRTAHGHDAEWDVADAMEAITPVVHDAVTEATDDA